MTKEELEKEAEVFVSEKADKGNFDVEKFGKAYFSESSMKQALVKFTEPREKQIEIDAEQIRALQKQNGELTDRVQELEAQIEKMKCCENCKYYNNHYNEVVCKQQVINCKRILRQATRDQWEIKEKMTVLEKIKRCVSLVWDFQEFYGDEDIEDFCSNELCTYSQYNEILDYFKRIADLEKENAELKERADKADLDSVLFFNQLCKAKEIIREFVKWANWQGNSKCPSFKSIQNKAEQFISEVEK